MIPKASLQIRDAEAAGSNPVASILGRGTGNRLDKGFPVLFCFCWRQESGRKLACSDICSNKNLEQV